MILKGDIGKLEIKVLKRSNSETDDYWDGNWLESEIRIDVPGFNTLYGTNLRVDDLQRFYEKLTDLQSRNINEAEFTTMEEGLYLHCELVANGLIECKGKANNDTGNSLNFRLQTDLASLDIFVNELKMILKSYPLVGSLE
ncbi:MAG: hypothetical protein LBD80_09555 [Tannerella sp.]|jgi:hypothetical protein|nr:hypothetical protein [Tannerella sp.]